jgi:hypothetical protein
MNKYYVYGHYFKDTDELFYIGKGSGARSTKNDRSANWKHAVADREWYVKILHDNLTNSEALDLEQNLIQDNLSTLINVKINTRTIEIPAEVFSAVYYDETSPTCLRYAKPSIGITGRIYKSCGDIAGVLMITSNKKKKRYAFQYNGVKYYVHRIVYGLFHKLSLDKVIDHINGDSCDNRIENLREVSQQQNARNLKREPNSTGVVGVTKVKRKRLKSATYIASAYTLDGKLIQKEFGVKTYGEERAFALAVQWRQQKIKELNEQGAGYSDRHGT